MQSRSGMAMDLASSCISLKAANPCSSKESCYKLQCSTVWLYIARSAFTDGFLPTL